MTGWLEIIWPEARVAFLRDDVHVRVVLCGLAWNLQS